MLFKPLKTHHEIGKAFDIFLELRPHLTHKENFTKQILTQVQEGYEMIALEENDEIVACIGFRFLTTLAWGKILYIDDLVTQEKTQRKGYAQKLLDHVIQIGKNHSCNAVHLDTGYTRHKAHKLYLKQGFTFNAHHLELKLFFSL